MTLKRIEFLQLFFEGPGVVSGNGLYISDIRYVYVFYQHMLPFAATGSTMIEFPRFFDLGILTFYHPSIWVSHGT